MMPKGVEHSIFLPTALKYSIVERTMMPKGVEHKIYTGTRTYTGCVERTMMPKGVEHGNRPSVDPVSEEWNEQ